MKLHGGDIRGGGGNGAHRCLGRDRRRDLRHQGRAGRRGRARAGAPHPPLPAPHPAARLDRAEPGGALSGWRRPKRHGRVADMRTTPDPYRAFRFPAEIIAHAVWLYHCFRLSLREVETILAERGVVVSHESIRAWSLRFGRAFADALEKRRPRPGDKWHLDEVFIRIGGKLRYLWRAVDQHGTVLDVLVQGRRSAKAAERF